MKILLSFYEVPKKKNKFPKITDAQKNPCWFTCQFFVRMFSDNANSFEDSLESLKAKNTDNSERLLWHLFKRTCYDPERFFDCCSDSKFKF